MRGIVLAYVIPSRRLTYGAEACGYAVALVVDHAVLHLVFGDLAPGAFTVLSWRLSAYLGLRGNKRKAGG